ncbi:hypothetical protein Ana3638_10960 [Anaerocolumna sedimenticola]|uniref:Uncharacterized protein n=1 Tax=Anaerocolumna sedimenticola TaxID=2696063 RepID=A0A6P1TLR3_9FIRM|nr:hypothetical protein [Anaerocolumna sedimenticola]QHQ61227.1 hypothetical protein Ana3638_10960 [Anaerocolumna sedimenticola]
MTIKLLINLNPKNNRIKFTNYGIRVRFGKYSLANQIYIMNNDIEINGLKIGDPISGFEKKFGEPVKDNSGNAHFKYKYIYLSGKL